jgi:addiction module HigA family antidote
MESKLMIRMPTHPGEMLWEEFLEPMKIPQAQLAQAIRVPYQRVNELINGRRGVTPSTALRLSKYFEDYCFVLDESSTAMGSVPCHS